MQTTTAKIDPQEEVDFMEVDETDYSAFTVAQRIHHLEVEGYVVLPDVLDSEQIATLKAAARDLPMKHKDYSEAQTYHHEPQCASEEIGRVDRPADRHRFSQGTDGARYSFYARLVYAHPGRFAGYFDAYRRPALWFVHFWL